ncbi:MAG: hypothetical protein HY858_11145 [Candidatus Solibacter usitatus]|nr:hypothetical protein [Candidatus Solibacter usitatus]
MILIQRNQLAGLEWRQPGAFARTFELRAGDSLLARLEFKKTLGTLAEAETAQGKWSFKRTGFLSPVVSARVRGEEADIAIYRPSFSGQKGALRLAGGEALELHALGFWGSEWALTGAGGEHLLRFHNKGLVHHGADVEVGEAARGRQDLELLLTLAWYILVLHMEDSTVMTPVVMTS